MTILILVSKRIIILAAAVILTALFGACGTHTENSTGKEIGTAGTEDVAAAYAATYPIALIAVVLVSQFLILLF